MVVFINTADQSLVPRKAAGTHYQCAAAQASPVLPFYYALTNFSLPVSASLPEGFSGRPLSCSWVLQAWISFFSELPWAGRMGVYAPDVLILEWENCVLHLSPTFVHQMSFLLLAVMFVVDRPSFCLSFLLLLRWSPFTSLPGLSLESCVNGRRAVRSNTCFVSALRGMVAHF